MSDIKQVLDGLATVGHPRADQALANQVDQIEQKLFSSSEYETLAEELDKLSGISYNVSNKAIKPLVSFLDVIDQISFSYRSIDGAVFDFQEYKNAKTLTIKVLNILDQIRYHQTEEILVIMLKYSLHEEEDIRKRAQQSIEALASYNIEALVQIGYHPQLVIIKYLDSLKDSELEHCLEPLIILCRELLSSTIHGEKWNADTLTISRGGIKSRG